MGGMVMKKRILGSVLAVALAFVMAVGVLPVSVFAAEAGFWQLELNYYYYSGPPSEKFPAAPPNEKHNYEEGWAKGGPDGYDHYTQFNEYKITFEAPDGNSLIAYSGLSSGDENGNVSSAGSAWQTLGASENPGQWIRGARLVFASGMDNGNGGVWGDMYKADGSAFLSSETQAGSYSMIGFPIVDGYEVVKATGFRIEQEFLDNVKNGSQGIVQSASVYLRKIGSTATPDTPGVDYSKDDFENDEKNGTLYIYRGTGGELVIPEGIQNIQGNSAGHSNGFANSGVTRITLPKSLRTLEYGAFSGCSSLKSVTIQPNSIKEIANETFRNTALESIVIPQGVEIIYGGFQDCAALRSVTIAESVIQIAAYTFDGSPNVTIYGVSGSYAEKFAKEKGIPFIAGTAPTSAQPTPTPPALSAAPSKTAFLMNGKAVSVPEAYNVADNNYLQVRGIAALLNGTAAQFNVSWDGSYAVIETGKPYSGTSTPAALAPTTNVRKSATQFKIDGSVVSYDNAYLIDGATNYIQLREFAEKLNGTASQFNVYWDSSLKQAVIEPGNPYTGVK
jgi:hypothetical protein